jgi:hypothetical protein
MGLIPRRGRIDHQKYTPALNSPKADQAATSYTVVSGALK